MQARFGELRSCAPFCARHHRSRPNHAGVSIGKQKRSRRAVHLFLTLLALYVLLALFVMLVQRKLIYFPTTLSSEFALRLGQQEGLVPWRNSTGKIIGWQFPATSAPAGTVLIVHGNGGHALNRGYFARPICEAAIVDVFVLEYPGYGARDGSPNMRGFLAAADEAFSLLPTNRSIYIVAESLGSGVAAHLARKFQPRVSGLIFFAPYADLAAVGQRQMPIFPVKLLRRDRFKPSEWLKDYRGPVKVVLAEADAIIPATFGQELYDNYAGPKSIEVISGAGHNDIAGQEAGWWKEVFSFWRTNRQPD